MASLLMLFSLSLSAQQQTPNILGNWSGVTNGTLPANRMPGSSLLYDSATGTVNWSYNTATASKTAAINSALRGTGIQIGGYNYSYDLRNMNGDDRQGSVDTMTVNTSMTNSAGVSILSDSVVHNTKFDWTTFSYTKNFPTGTTPGLADVGNVSISFTSRDVGFWAGYFGPEVRNVSMSVNYTADPCAGNALALSSCPGFTDIVTSNPILQQSYAINQALGLSGANVKIHGFDYGYTTNFGSQPCTSTFLFWCTGWSNSTIDIGVSVTDSAGASLYNQTHSHNGADSSQSYSYSYVLPSTKLLSTMGNFSLVESTWGNASISNVWSTWKYTPDPCEVNPLSDPTCPNYATAYHANQCSMSALFATDCPGYAAAYLTQQCNITGQLYSASCPGYSTAFFNFQCNANPLYSVDCPGYQVAYYEKKCTEDPLYDKGCNGFDKAYAKKYVLPASTSTSTVSVAKSETTESVSEVPSTTSPTSPTSVTSVVKAPETVSTVSVAQTTNDKSSEKKTEEPKKEASVAKALAKTSVTEKAKELANTMSKAATMEDQVAAQGALVGVMGYVAGFSAYQNAIVPDVMGLQMARKYSKPVVDNRSVQRRMTGASEGLHRQMVEQQYNLGN